MQDEKVKMQHLSSCIFHSFDFFLFVLHLNVHLDFSFFTLRSSLNPHLDFSLFTFRFSFKNALYCSRFALSLLSLNKAGCGSA